MVSRLVLSALAFRFASALRAPGAPRAASARLRARDGGGGGGRVVRTEAEWRDLLSAEQFSVLRGAGTEPPRSSPLNDVDAAGTFACAGCGEPLFTTAAKFDSGTGWPSFYAPVDGAAVEPNADFGLGLPRTEVACASCGGHLGHVFDDGPRPTGERYCMNGVAMVFSDDAADPARAAAVAARSAAGAPVRRPVATILPGALLNALLSGAFFSQFEGPKEGADLVHLLGALLPPLPASLPVPPLRRPLAPCPAGSASPWCQRAPAAFGSRPRLLHASSAAVLHTGRWQRQTPAGCSSSSSCC